MKAGRPWLTRSPPQVHLTLPFLGHFQQPAVWQDANNAAIKATTPGVLAKKDARTSKRAHGAVVDETTGMPLLLHLHLPLHPFFNLHYTCAFYVKRIETLLYLWIRAWLYQLVRAYGYKISFSNLQIRHPVQWWMSSRS